MANQQEQNQPAGGQQPVPAGASGQIQVKITDEVLKGVYSNQAMIRHTKDEFVIDFLNFVVGDPNAIANARIIISPVHAKSLVAALQENVQKYEGQFGKISLAGASETQHKMGFKTE